MTRLTLTWPDGLDFTAMEATVNALEAEYACHVHVDHLLDEVEVVASLDVVLSLARSCSYAHPDRDRSIRAVEGLRAKLREAIR